MSWHCAECFTFFSSFSQPNTVPGEYYHHLHFIIPSWVVHEILPGAGPLCWPLPLPVSTATCLWVICFPSPPGMWRVLLQLWRGWPGCGDCTWRSPWITRSVRPSGTTMIPKATVDRSLSGWTQTHHRAVCGFIYTAFIWVVYMGYFTFWPLLGPEKGHGTLPLKLYQLFHFLISHT